MNTIKGYMNEFHLEKKISKKELLRRVDILTDTVQALIDRIAEKEKIQLGVMSECRRHGIGYFLYQQPLAQCAVCLKDLPPQKYGDEVYLSENKKDYLCYECFTKLENTPK